MSAVAFGWRLAVLLAGLVVLWPARTRDLGPHPRPLSSYAAATTVIDRQRAADSLVVAAGGEPILLVHGAKTPRAIVLLHGFTNSPQQFLPLALALFASGDNVYVPRMPHHAERGRDVSALAAITAEELRNCADSAVDLATGLGDSVIVAGLSMGGTMAAWIAVFRPEVRRVVIIAPLIAVARVPGILDGPAMNLVLRLPNVNLKDPPDTARPDRDLGLSTRATAEILRLGTAVQDAPSSDVPRAAVWILLNEHDRTIASGPVRALAANWSRGGAAVSIVELPDSLGLPHDVIDITDPQGNPCVVYPMVESMIAGRAPGTARSVSPFASAGVACR